MLLVLVITPKIVYSITLNFLINNEKLIKIFTFNSFNVNFLKDLHYSFIYPMNNGLSLPPHFIINNINIPQNRKLFFEFVIDEYFNYWLNNDTHTISKILNSIFYYDKLNFCLQKDFNCSLQHHILILPAI